MQEIKKYYEELWGNCTKNNENEIASYLKIIENLAFYNHEITKIDNWITEHEVQFAINQLNNNSSPGSDGLTAEFYKTFQKLIIPELTKVFNNILLNKELPNSMKEATIKLLYKKNDHKNLKNWQPISLLNNDYKILSKIIVNRLSPLLQNYILPQQNAGIPGRKIENVHYNIQAILEIAEQWGEKIILMTIDFEKAFDKISHQLIFKTLEKLNIGKKNLEFLKLFYRDIYSKIEINGITTTKIKINRGIRQGCLLSMLLFITCSDLLTRHILKNKQIKGITLQKTNFKIIQYTDDTTFACQDFLEIKKIQEELHKFEKVSGLKINSEKTQILTTSLSFQEKIKLHYPTFNIKDSFKLLGIKFFLNPNQKMKNWKEVISKIRGIILKHDTRNLSIFGKIQIIKTLVIPLFIHIARIYRPTTKIIKEINQILYKFLWTKHPIEQLSRSKLIAEIKEGGIKMIDIESKINTCYVEKIKYLVNIDQSSEIWHQWATYNLFYKIKHINKKLFDRTKAHNLFEMKLGTTPFPYL